MVLIRKEKEVRDRVFEGVRSGNLLRGEKEETPAGVRGVSPVAPVALTAAATTVSENNVWSKGRSLIDSTMVKMKIAGYTLFMLLYRLQRSIMIRISIHRRAEA